MLTENIDIVSKKVESINEHEPVDTSDLEKKIKELEKQKEKDQELIEKHEEKIKLMRKDIGILKRTKGKS